MLYFPYLGEAPTGPIRPKSCVVGDVRDIITCAKFQIEIFMGYNFTGGQIFDFPIDFCMGLTTVHLWRLFVVSHCFLVVKIS